MSKLISTLCITVLAATSAYSQSFFEESFGGSIPDNFTGSWAYNTADFDGIGGSGDVAGFSTINLATGTSASVFEAGSFEFSFYLDSSSAATYEGGRIMFLSPSGSTTNGFGVNFNYNPEADTFEVWARVGTTQSSVNNVTQRELLVSSGSLLTGVATIGSGGLGNVSISSGGMTVFLDNDASYATLGDTIGLRGNGRPFTIDGISVNQVAAIPEPHTTAALIGLAVLGFSFYRRRSK